MNDMEMHLRKVIEMSKFRLSSNYNYLTEAVKVKFVTKQRHHAMQCERIITDVFKQLYDFVRWITKEVITSFIREVANILRQIDWSMRDEHSQSNNDVLC